MPGTKWKRSLQSPEMYEALRKKGYSQESAARISNAKAPGHTVVKGGKKAK